MEDGLVFNIQRYCMHDGPGIRTTVFLKGCPLACWWCHNPESQDPRPELLIMENRCLHCGDCLKVCPLGSENRTFTSHVEGCTACGRCVEACPTEARQIAGQSMTTARVLHEVLKDRIFYEQSGGGVTFSGGEPFNQFPFLQSLLTACRGREIHTAVDTCGYTSWENLEAAAPLVDLFLYDVKLMDDERHQYFTGVSNVRILENLTRLSAIHRQIWIRVPLIPGVNDAAEDLEATAQFLGGLQGIRQVNLLPYHAGAQEKAARLGKSYALGKMRVSTSEIAGPAAEHFRRAGLNTVIGG